MRPIKASPFRDIDLEIFCDANGNVEELVNNNDGIANLDSIRSETGEETDLPVRLLVPINFFPLSNANNRARPNFTLTLLRTPTQPPNFASFIVPLNLNKLDLRDYLWNVYGISVRGVRSYIQQQKVRQDKPGEKRPKQRKWFRPRAIKKMMVEMEQPFVWPAVPEKLDE
jgi:hypothetical protein